MKTLKKILFVQRPELENKWWHRLAKVLIYGSTLLLLIRGLFFNGLLSSPPVIPFSDFPIMSQVGLQDLTKVSLIDVSNKLAQAKALMLQNNASSEQIEKFTKEVQDTYWGMHLGLYSLLVCIIVLMWFIFWESIVYRAVVYVIYGKNKKIS